MGAKNLDQLYSSINQLYDVLDHANHIFSESSKYPLSNDPLPTHPSPTQTYHTHKTHKEPTQMPIFPLYDVQHFTNQIFYETSCYPLSTDCCDRDQGLGSRIGIKDWDQGSGSRIGIKDAFYYFLGSRSG